MKVVYCVDHLRRDGTQRVLGELVAGLSAAGHAQAVLCLNDSWDEAVRARLAGAGASVFVVGRAALRRGSGIVTAWRWLRHERPDALVTLLFAADVLGRTLGRLTGVPRIVSSLRARNLHYRPWQRRLVRATMRWADAVVLPSAAGREFAITEEGARPERLHVIPNGVRVEDYGAPMDRGALRRELSLAPMTPLVGSVGRLTPQKGYDVLVHALGAPGLDAAHVLLVGQGEEAERLQRAAAAAGVGGRFHLAGPRGDVPRLLGALDCYVQPSRFEGMPNALLEAMAAGCPVVATAVDGNCELIPDEAHGWLVPPDDACSLATAIRAALDDPASARHRGAAARARAAAVFGVDAMVATWARVLGGGPARRA